VFAGHSSPWESVHSMTWKGRRSAGGVRIAVDEVLDVVAVPLVGPLGSVLQAPFEILIEEFYDQRAVGAFWG
jgi:hypothetical protein